MFISDETLCADEVDVKPIGYSERSSLKRKAILRRLWKEYPMAERICLVERGGSSISLAPGHMEVFYVMPKRGLWNRVVEVRVGQVLAAIS